MKNLASSKIVFIYTTVCQLIYVSKLSSNQPEHTKTNNFHRRNPVSGNPHSLGFHMRAKDLLLQIENKLILRVNHVSRRKRNTLAREHQFCECKQGFSGENPIFCEKMQTFCKRKQGFSGDCNILLENQKVL